ncbi:MAG: hypothetical protein DCF19_00765 [Pseudanabaena frigida]|uniref:Uncharacterized protein n=1 Tax=Pseudanabaena frigida TaxID=945775 RepID=A0A2W4YQB6_9CYAN|nr:MAG: hypothetical protein DCF19_00765 [Pseudanabaena frigida]
MARRSSVNYLDRLYASLVYLLPITSVVLFGKISLFSQIPILETIFLPILKIDEILSTSIIDFISIRLVVWFSIFFLVVRSYKINHFIRFNAIQALLLDIVVALVSVTVKLLGKVSFLYFILEIILNVTFLGITAAFLYSVFQCALGKYAEIPVISEAAYHQTH